MNRPYSSVDSAYVKLLQVISETIPEFDVPEPVLNSRDQETELVASVISAPLELVTVNHLPLQELDQPVR